MSMMQKLWQDTKLYSIAHFSTSLLAFLMLPIYTTYFSPAAYGTWDLFFTTMTLLIPLVSFELSAATYRWLLQTNEEKDQRIAISTGFFALLTHTGISIIIAIIVFLLVDFPFQVEALVLLLSMLSFSFMQQCVRGLQLNRLFAWMSVLQSFIMISFNLYFILYLHLDIVAFFYAHIIANIIVILISWRKSKFSTYLSYTARSRKVLRGFYTYAWPIIPATASWWIMTMSDRWFISGFLGVASNGIYAIALKIPAILLMINTVFSLAWKDNAIIYIQKAEKDEHYTIVFRRYVRILASVVILLILLAKPVIIIFLDAAYADAWKYSGILLVATLFHAFALFWSAGFHAAKRTKAIFYSSVIGAIVNIVGNLLLIPIWGLYGIATATMIAFFVTWIMRVRAANGIFRVKLPIGEMIGWAIVITGVMIVIN